MNIDEAEKNYYMPQMNNFVTRENKEISDENLD